MHKREIVLSRLRQSFISLCPQSVSIDIGYIMGGLPAQMSFPLGARRKFNFGRVMFSGLFPSPTKHQRAEAHSETPKTRVTSYADIHKPI
jgi:hypothetical protein